MTFKLTRTLFFGFIILLASCSPTVYTRISQTHPALQSNEEVRLIGLTEKVPDSAIVIGSVKIGDSGFTTDCGWNTVIEKARMEARKIGGNGVKITAHILPTALGSTCHRITADILKLKPVTENVPPSDVAPQSPASTRIVPADTAPVYTRAAPRSEQDKQRLLNPRTHFRLGIQGGFSYLTATTSSSVPAFMKSYIDELKSGAHWGANFSFFVNDNIGFGVRYSSFNTSNTFNGQIVLTNTTTGQSRVGGMSDDVTINFIGPEFCLRFYSANNKFCFLAGLAIGYADYKNKALLIDRYTFTGNTLGYGVHVGLDYVFDKNIGLGIAISTCNGSLSSMVQDDGRTKKTISFKSGEFENISRIDFSGGLRFYF